MRVNNNKLIFSVLFIYVHSNTNSLHISHEGKKILFFFLFPQNNNLDMNCKLFAEKF